MITGKEIETESEIINELKNTDWAHGLQYVLRALGVNVSDPHTAEIERQKILSNMLRATQPDTYEAGELPLDKPTKKR